MSGCDSIDRRYRRENDREVPDLMARKVEA